MTPLFVLGKVPLKCPLAFIFEKKKNIQKSSPQLYSDNGGEKKNDTNVCMHITSKRIELESPGWSGLVRF